MMQVSTAFTALTGNAAVIRETTRWLGRRVTKASTFSVKIGGALAVGWVLGAVVKGILKQPAPAPDKYTIAAKTVEVPPQVDKPFEVPPPTDPVEAHLLLFRQLLATQKADSEKFRKTKIPATIPEDIEPVAIEETLLSSQNKTKKKGDIHV